MVTTTATLTLHFSRLGASLPFNPTMVTFSVHATVLPSGIDTKLPFVPGAGAVNSAGGFSEQSPFSMAELTMNAVTAMGPAVQSTHGFGDHSSGSVSLSETCSRLCITKTSCSWPTSLGKQDDTNYVCALEDNANLATMHSTKYIWVTVEPVNWGQP